MSLNDDWFWILLACYIIFICSCTSCSDNIIMNMQRGVIINKEYHPAYTETTYIQVGDIQVPIEDKFPEYWTVDVYGDMMYMDNDKIRKEKYDGN
jgi:hypothetical protein